MAKNIKKIKVGATTYDIYDATKLPKVTYEWNKEFAAGSNGAISLGRYNIYDSQLTFDITSTTNKSISGKLVIATQNGTIYQAKVFGDASGALVSKLIIYQSAISNSRSWVEVFCNFNGWSKNKVHVYAVALNSATVQKQMTSVTISNGVPAAANVTSGDTKWTGTIVNDFSHSHGISIATSSGTNQLNLAHGTKYALTAGGQSFIFTTPSDNNTWRKVQLNGADKLGTGTNTNPLNIKAGSNMTITESNGTFTFAATAIKTLKTDHVTPQPTNASEAIAGTGAINLHKISKTGSYSDLNDKPTNLVTTNTEQYITGKKCFETELNFGKYVSAYRAVGDAPANLHLMNSSQTTAGFFDTVIFAGAGDWLYLGHLKPTFSIKASFQGNGEESDAYSASLGYTRGWLDFLTDWDYQRGWMVRPTKVSTTTPAIIQIKFTGMLYTDVLRLILTGHNLNDSSGNYSGFLDDYTIEVCTDYAKDTWTTVVNRTNANDNIGKGLIYAMQTGSYTTCYGIRLKITKCHVSGNGFAYIKITSMQLRDYRPGFKFPDCLGAISQGGGDVWGQLNIKSILQTHTIVPEDASTYYIGTGAKPYYGIYANDFYERGTSLSDKYLAKGTSSTVVSQIVYNPVEMKKALTVPSIQTTPIQYSPTDYDSAVSLGYTTVNGKTVAQIQLACPGLGYTRITQDDSTFKIAANDTLSCDSGYGWRINESKIITEANFSFDSATGTLTIN